MFRKSSILALAAVASLGAFALSSSSASAFGFGGHGGFHGPVQASHVGGLHFGGNHFGGNHFGGNHFGGLGFRRIGNWYPRHHWTWWRWRPHYWAYPVVAGGVATYAATTTPTYNRCTCLTKEYTPQGSVVFKDICTNEMAMNPPATGPVTGDIAPQQPATVGYAEQPQQQGYLQPQVR